MERPNQNDPRPAPSLAPADALLLPPGSCLVHIGPPKTGTTAVQGAFDVSRAETDALGVHYAGAARHSSKAVQSVTERVGFFTDGQPIDIVQWERLVKDSRTPGMQRTVVSSEFFADATSEHIPRIVRDLGPERVQVVVTLRPLAKIVPSQWQQYVQSGMRVSFPAWLDAMFVREPGKLTPTFWLRHRHDALVRRWTEAVGADRVTVVAVDDRDHGMLLRTFEGLTGLPEGALVQQPDVTNRSMSFPEIEAVRALNILFREEDLPHSAQSRLVHFGATLYMREVDPSDDEQRVQTPRWAAERIEAIAQEMVSNIRASGVRVVGDLDRMAPAVGDSPDDIPETVDIPAAVAARMAMGVVFATGASGRPLRARLARPITEPSEVTHLSTSQLGRILANRVRAGSARRAGLARDALRPAKKPTAD